MLQTDCAIADERDIDRPIFGFCSSDIAYSPREHLLKDGMSLCFCARTKGSAENASEPIFTSIGQCVESITPGSLPEHLGILGNEIEQIDSLNNSEGCIDTARHIMIRNGNTGDNFAARSTGAMQRSQDCAKLIVFIIRFYRVTQADQSSTTPDKRTKCLLLLLIERADIPIEHDNPLLIQVV